MFKKILCGVDGSKLAEKAARYAADIAGKCAGELVLIYVAPIPIVQLLAPSPSMLTPELMPLEVEKSLKRKGARVLAELKEKIAAPDLKLETRLELGHPSDTIAQVAGDEKFDLIVVGSRGMSELKRIFLGSVSTQLVHSSPVPILIIK